METGLGSQNQELKETSFYDEKLGQNVVRKGNLDFPPRKVWMKTFGCQMNYHDTERILTHLKVQLFKNGRTR